MRSWLKRVRHTLNGRSVHIFVGGLVFVVIYNAIAWLRDRGLASRLLREQASDVPDITEHVSRRISILVAAWNEANSITRHIESVRALKYPNLEYVLCAGGIDGTYELAKRYAGPDVIVLEQRPGEGKQAALRRCLEQATGDVLFLTDADCVLDDRSFTYTVWPVLNGLADAATGSYRPLPEQLTGAGHHALAVFRWSAGVYDLAHASTETEGLTGANAAIARHALERSGAFCADVQSGTDYYLAKSLCGTGARIRRVCGSEVSTDFPTNFALYARQQRRWLRNVITLGWRSGSRGESVAALRTVVIGLGMVVTPLAAIKFGPVLAAGWALAVLHSAVSKVRYVAFTSRLNGNLDHLLKLKVLWMALPVSLLDFAVWCLPIVDLLHAKRRHQW